MQPLLLPLLACWLPDASPPLTRRTVIMRTASSALAIGPAAAVVADDSSSSSPPPSVTKMDASFQLTASLNGLEDSSPSPPFTKMDAFQLKSSLNALEDALGAWRIEIAQVQLGNEPSSVVAVAGLSDETLRRFASCGVEASASTAAFQQQRGTMLQNLYLARGAARYEKDLTVATEYANKAQLEAEAARSALGALAKVCNVDVTKSASARQRAAEAGAPEDKLTFTPRPSQPSTVNKLIF